MVKRFMPILALTVSCWLVLGLDDLVLQGKLVRCGILPRHLSGLTGIIWAPFIHGSVRHLAANTLPLLVMGAVICACGRSEFIFVTVVGIAFGGSLTWLVGRSAYHIGASGLIFCYFGYLSSLAWFRRSFGTLCLSVVCVLAYGGILRGLMPASAGVSWESHIAGLITGVVIAAVMAKFKMPSGAPRNT